MPARPIFIGGTSSNAGKSWTTTAVCAWLRRKGVRVAPFKAQNMSNHSYPCRSGGEIGRAQVAQAEACGLEPEPAMNPILLKPNGNGTSQVVVNGVVWKTLPARGYYEYFDELLTHVLAAYEDLASRFDVIVIEGAGSVSELNLRAFDLVNLGLVTRIRAPWVLVADIERGGVFASVLGTVSLLTPEERALFRGFMVNKFRGDMTLFDEGRRLLESKAAAPCLGVFPYAQDLRVDAEDSLALEREARSPAPAGASIAILEFPRLSNGTDFRLLRWADWVSRPRDRDYDFVILPGSKDTLSDLAWMRDRGLDRWVHEQHRRGATVVGICGGFQMLGDMIHDPAGIESSRGSERGLGLLPVETVLTSEKTTRVRRATLDDRITFSAYEIHLGQTTSRRALSPFVELEDGTTEGVRGERLIGTYLHGALEDPQVCSALFGVEVNPGPAKAGEHEALAAWFEHHAVAPERWLL
ncbi:MAG: cobyric acid synthase [Acidobacteria bacterium]|nr:cobyric acid synthase [Acidobacteriota bacterium]